MHITPSIQNNNFKTVILGVILAATFFLGTAQFVNAQSNASGWFVPTFTATGPASSCAAGEAAVVIQISEHNSRSIQSENVGIWRVIIRDADGNRIGGQTLNGQKTSSPLCFNPNVAGIQVDFAATSLLQNLRTLTVYPSSDLSTMIGNQYTGYVHVKDKSNPPSHDIEGLYPLAQKVNDVPEFVLRTNALPATDGYSITGLNSVKLFVINANTNETLSQTIPMTGGVGTRVVSDFAELPLDGHYFWTYYQELNGQVTFGTSTRTPLPASGITGLSTFTLDRQAPTITNYATVGTVSVSGSNVNLRFSAEVEDTLAGVATTSLYLLNSSDQVVGVSTVNLGASLSESLVAFNVTLAEDALYKYYYTVSDAVGNTATSAITTFTTLDVDDTLSLTLPEMEAQSAENITSTGATMRSEIVSTGSSLVTVRGICWSDRNDEPYADLYCTSASSTAGFAAEIFSFTHNTFPESRIIRYRGFATNAAGTVYSEIRSFVTQPSAFATSTDPLPPNISATAATSITADKATLEARINAIGGGLITYRAICWAVTEAALPATTVGTASSSACHALPGSLPDSATLPYSFSYRFTGLPYNSNLWYRVYAQNSFGLATDTRQFTTEPAWHDFKAVFASEQKYHNDLNFNYMYRLVISAEDLSNYTFIGGNRVINYQIRFTDPGGTLHLRNGTIEARALAPLAQAEFLFNNIPYGYGQVEITVEPIMGTYPELTSPTDRTLNNTFSFIATFPDPNEILDLISGDTSGIGTITDPNLELVMPNRIIRSGEEGVISWDTNETYAMNCEVRGPATFGNNGVITFDPSVDGAVGSSSTGPLTSAQTFDISCTEPITGTVFSTTTRIDVAGRLQEN